MRIWDDPTPLILNVFWEHARMGRKTHPASYYVVTPSIRKLAATSFSTAPSSLILRSAYQPGG